jgi:hypothetical protein
MTVSAILAFDYGLDPDTIESMPLSRLLTWITAGNKLHSDRTKKRGS